MGKRSWRIRKQIKAKRVLRRTLWVREFFQRKLDRLGFAVMHVQCRLLSEQLENLKQGKSERVDFSKLKMSLIDEFRHPSTYYFQSWHRYRRVMQHMDFVNRSVRESEANDCI